MQENQNWNNLTILVAIIIAIAAGLCCTASVVVGLAAMLFAG